MKTMKAGLVLLLTLFGWWSVPAQANGEGYAGCIEAVRWMSEGQDYVPRNELGVGVCMGTIQGVRDMATVSRVEMGSSMFCVPKHIRMSVIIGRLS